MDEKGLIKACKNAGCGFKCCSFGSTHSSGYTIMLPGEYENANGSVTHLQIVDDNYFGGKKVRCTAKEPFCCDGGYKPIQCRAYPLWVSCVGDKTILKSLKCPLQEEILAEHSIDALRLFTDYPYSSKKDLDLFLSKAKVDRYKIYGSQHCCENEYLGILSSKDLESILDYEKQLNDANLCFKSSESIIKRCLNLGCSVGVYINGDLSAYSLCYYNEYGIGYIDKCFVSPEQRGQGWQVSMLLKNINLLISKNIKIIYSMASPSNWVSTRSFKQVGFKEIYPVSVSGHNRTVLFYQCNVLNGNDVVEKAQCMKQEGYVYLFGGKGNVVTAEYIHHMAKMYPDIYTPEIVKLSENKIGKICVDCSGFVSLATKTSYGDSLGIFSHLRNCIRTSDIKKLKSGMVLYKKGHVGIVDASGEGSIIEAKDTKSNIVCSSFKNRAYDFDFCGELEGVSYDNVNTLEL